MILTAASTLYGAAATWRRTWYARDPNRRRRLGRPVISVGNLRVGGSGKTPVVACLARLLAARGETPAILSRGYARENASDGVTVVSDGRRVLATLDRAGDEPLMLARALPGIPVVVGNDRYVSGRLAERQLGATVHLLDDGFQHLALARDVDLVLASEADLDDRLLPAGRLREPLRAASSADALLSPANPEALRRLASALGVATAFRVISTLVEPRPLARSAGAPPGPGVPIFGVAGIARPDRFFTDLQAAGHPLAGTLAFRDHHRYSRADVERIERAARHVGAAAVMTTEKDAVRLEALPLSLPFFVIAQTVDIDPAGAFIEWLTERLTRSR